MNKVAVLDDWQNIARDSADFGRCWLPGREVTFFNEALADEDDAAGQTARLRHRAVDARAHTAAWFTDRSAGPVEDARDYRRQENASLDSGACTARGVVACGCTGYPDSLSAPAELALGLLLAVVRDIPAADAGIRAGRFPGGTTRRHHPCGRKTLGVVGLGRLGTCMARYGNALEMKVLAWSQNLTAETAAAAGAELVTKEDLFARADAISVHLVLSPRSRHIIGAAEIGRMKPGAVLINTSRGPLIDEDALALALEQRRIFAGLDVFDRELAAGPPPAAKRAQHRADAASLGSMPSRKPCATSTRRAWRTRWQFIRWPPAPGYEPGGTGTLRVPPLHVVARFLRSSCWPPCCTRAGMPS